MKKIAYFLVFISLLDAKVITILDNGVQRKIALPIPPNGMQARMINTSQTNELIIKLKKGVNPNEFAKKFSLRLKKILKLPNYYIFKNESGKSISMLIVQIIQKSKDEIQTIRPNFCFGLIAR